jgi:general stress protein YciG
MNARQKEIHCKARTKAGKPCGAAATAGGLCFFHANPNKASELGRKGGRSKRHTAAESSDPLPPLDNAIAVRETVARLIADVLAGKVHPRVAAGLAPLLNLQMRAIETANIEQRLAKLEQESKLRHGGSDESKAAPDPDRGQIEL